MDEVQRLRLVSRQLRDIQVQAEKILKEDSSLDEIDAFGSYTRELKQFILRNFPSEEIIKTTNEIPEELYSVKTRDVALTGLAAFLVPTFILSSLSELRLKKESRENINLIRSKFGTVEFLIKATY
jgi:flagellar biosynthesis protein FliP